MKKKVNEKDVSIFYDALLVLFSYENLSSDELNSWLLDYELRVQCLFCGNNYTWSLVDSQENADNGLEELPNRTSLLESNKLYINLRQLIESGEKIAIEEFHQAEPLCPAHISGPKSDEWLEQVNIFNERYLKNKHPSYESIFKLYFHKNSHPKTVEKVIATLKAVLADEDFFKENSTSQNKSLRDNKQDMKVKGGNEISMNRKVFIVHGHDDGAIAEISNFLRKLKLEPVVLKEQPNKGLTIIEKIEEYSDVSYGIVLYTPCDLGRAVEETDLKQRARQNVVFEHGYLIAKLKRENVAALVKGKDIEIPGDCSGILYIQMNSGWELDLAKNMQAAGLDIDCNLL